MIELKNTELMEVRGGSITSSLINAAVRGINALLELGRSLGTAIRRVTSGGLCK